MISTIVKPLSASNVFRLCEYVQILSAPFTSGLTSEEASELVWSTNCVLTVSVATVDSVIASWTGRR